MKLLLSLFAQFLCFLVMLCRKDGLSAVIAQNLLLTRQLTILNRGREGAPNIKPIHRILLGFSASFLSKGRLKQAAMALRPATLLRFREFLSKQNYRLLFTPKKRGKPGPKGPSPEIMTAVVDFKRRIPAVVVLALLNRSQIPSASTFIPMSSDGFLSIVSNPV